MMKKGKEKKDGEPKWYHTSKLEGGKRIYIPYPWKPGEKEEYEKICLLAEGWCGIPMDINWAKSTQPYQEALKKINHATT